MFKNTILTGVVAGSALIFFGLAGNANASSTHDFPVTDYGYTSFVKEYVHEELRFNGVTIPAFRVCIYKDVSGYLFGDTVPLTEKCDVDY